jgi:hypothetical protein
MHILNIEFLIGENDMYIVELYEKDNQYFLYGTLGNSAGVMGHKILMDYYKDISEAQNTFNDIVTGLLADNYRLAENGEDLNLEFPEIAQTTKEHKITKFNRKVSI